MATVSELCEALAKAANMPLDDVKKYARALINSGDLPKAIGRSVPTTDMHQRAKLILAIAASERPANCVKAMRDRYEAVERFGDIKATAGEVLAGELRELESKSYEAFQKWTYSQLEVSRNGMPRVVFRINETMRGYSGFENVKQPEFLGGPWLAMNEKELAAFGRERQGQGLSVSAYVPGNVLIAAAFGSVEAADMASSEVIHAQKAKRGEKTK